MKFKAIIDRGSVPLFKSYLDTMSRISDTVVFVVADKHLQIVSLNHEISIDEYVIVKTENMFREFLFFPLDQSFGFRMDSSSLLKAFEFGSIDFDSITLRLRRSHLQEQPVLSLELKRAHEGKNLTLLCRDVPLDILAGAGLENYSEPVIHERDIRVGLPEPSKFVSILDSMKGFTKHVQLELTEGISTEALLEKAGEEDVQIDTGMLIVGARSDTIDIKSYFTDLPCILRPKLSYLEGLPPRESTLVYLSLRGLIPILKSVEASKDISSWELSVCHNSVVYIHRTVPETLDIILFRQAASDLPSSGT